MNPSERSTILDNCLKSDAEAPRGGAAAWVAVTILVFALGFALGYMASFFTFIMRVMR